MSSSIRQSNLFSAEDYQKIFKAYQFIDYTAYDFDTLKQALINYIQAYYPEDFNDYIESSEFIAIIELIAYLGTSLAFRTDLNSRENFIDTAERRESVIRLAQMVNYVPRRNIPTSGLMKIAAVQTDQQLVDANGVNLNGLAIYWNDPNNPDWFDQFVQICNAAFSTINPFGRPTKSGVIGSIPTDLYELNNVLRLNVTYPVTITVNGQTYPIDICNPNFVSGQTIFERDPDPQNAFNFIYRNDSLGVASANTGFFLYFKQGNLINIDTNFDFPLPNRLWEIAVQNINQDDVYVQETTQTGTVINKWLKVPALAGENIIYNSIQFGERNIFDVISGANDTVTIRFADGNFGNIPTGLFRAWVRVSANQNLVIRPTDAQGLQINIPYIGVDNQEYTLSVIFNLEQTIGNASAAETNEQIKLRAPEVFSTQSRMVNGSDYNVLPLIYGNQISKIQAINRTYSGMSRYIDLNDPTGFHRDLIIFGEDGALYRDDQNVLDEVVRDSSNAGTVEQILVNTIQEMLRNPNVYKFFYDEYIPQFEQTIRVCPPNSGRSLLDLVPTSGSDPAEPLFWRTSPSKFKNDTGYFVTSKTSSEAVVLDNTLSTNNVPGGLYQAWDFIDTGAILEFKKDALLPEYNTVSVNNVIQNGLPLVDGQLNPYAAIGPVELSLEIQNNFQATKVYPVFRNVLTTEEIQGDTANGIYGLVSRIKDGISFYMYYDVIKDQWNTSTSSNPLVSDQSTQPFVYPPPLVSGGFEQIVSDWAAYPDSGLVYISIDSNNQTDTTTYSLTARGRVYVFESYRDVRFYWEPDQVVIDSASGLALKDSIEVMPLINTNASINNNMPEITNPVSAFLKSEVSFNITGVFTQPDGYVDSSKVQVSLIDNNGDGIPDNPSGFNQIVSHNDRLVFEYYYNEVTGYQSTRPWVSQWSPSSWNTLMKTVDTFLYVYFPVDPNYPTKMYGSPYISTQYTPNPYTNPPVDALYLSEADLIFINNPDQILFNELSAGTRSIANQLSAFINNPSIFPWLSGSENIPLSVRNDILKNYFFNKSFLIESTVPGYGVYYALSMSSTLDPDYSNGFVEADIDKYHYDKNGKVFTQNLTIPIENRHPFYFKWSHFAPVDQRVDPAATNIVDMIVITDSYYRDMLIWKNSNGSIATQPPVPTTEELRVQFQDLNQYKMLSDNIVWNSGKFKILFGPTAAPELQATFKVVKSQSTDISDNEVKTKVIQSIDAYFDIRNWDFGEKFFYTELAAFIHQQLSRIISSIVIVPNNANSEFGNLFEITANPAELFMSTANVNNVQIVKNLTNSNLRM